MGGVGCRWGLGLGVVGDMGAADGPAWCPAAPWPSGGGEEAFAVACLLFCFDKYTHRHAHTRIHNHYYECMRTYPTPMITSEHADHEIVEVNADAS